jgi:hypothetical protein
LQGVLVAGVANFAPNFQSHLLVLFIPKVCKVRPVKTSGLKPPSGTPAASGRRQADRPRRQGAARRRTKAVAEIGYGKARDLDMHASAPSMAEPVTTLTLPVEGRQNALPSAVIMQLRDLRGISIACLAPQLATQTSINKLSRSN